jgi:predicted transcriptional regulator
MADRNEVIEQPIPRAWEGGKPWNAYPDEVRQQAVDLAIELRSGRKAARQLGISPRAVQAWLAEEVAGDAGDWNMLQIKELEGKIERILAKIGPEKIDKAGLRDLVVAAGILLDKRESLLPKAKNEARQRLRIAWKDGSGAVEIET